jgi:propionyl-CoA synthetase
MTYASAYAASLADPQAFWAEAARAIDWHRPFTAVLEPAAPHPRWFAGGELNTCHNAVDRHVANGRASQVALVHHSAMTGTVGRWTFAELQREVARTAGMLRACGVERGDRVVIYMPMIPQAVFAMLACGIIGM